MSTLDNILDVLEEARMREHFGKDLERMEDNPQNTEAFDAYREMYREQSKWAAKRIMRYLEDK